MSGGRAPWPGGASSFRPPPPPQRPPPHHIPTPPHYLEGSKFTHFSTPLQSAGLHCRGHQSLKCGAGICLGACQAGCSRHCRTEQTGTWQVIVSKVKVASYHLGAYDQLSHFCKDDQFFLKKRMIKDISSKCSNIMHFYFWRYPGQNGDIKIELLELIGQWTILRAYKLGTCQVSLLGIAWQY